jgi:hypothetical protein
MSKLQIVNSEASKIQMQLSFNKLLHNEALKSRLFDLFNLSAKTFLARFPQLWKISFPLAHENVDDDSTTVCNKTQFFAAIIKRSEKENRKMIISEHFASDRYL